MLVGMLGISAARSLSGSVETQSSDAVSLSNGRQAGKLNLRFWRLADRQQPGQGLGQVLQRPAIGQGDG
jgi:hypothetical protein